jgi:hypothetical protein
LKRRPAFSRDQLAFSFEVPVRDRSEGALAGLARVTSSAIARVLHEDGRSRRDLAFALSRLLDEDISTMTLDGWASEARDQFNAPFYRTLALIAATERFDVLDALMREIGAAVIFGDEIVTAQLGHIDRQIAALRDRRRVIEAKAQPIERASGTAMNQKKGAA